MSRGIEALAEAPMLVWAREKAGFDADTAAAKLEIDAETLTQWESGVEHPTIADLRRLAALYRRPISIFYLSEPPKDFDPQREFRRLPNLGVEDESPEMRLALRRALYLREGAREIATALHQEIPRFTGSAKPDEDPDVVGKRIRDYLGVSWKDQLAWSSPSGALNAWRAAIERVGILVFQTGRVDLKEMRGISIPHGPWPAILLNNADSPHGRIFSLLHEFAHILFENAGFRTSAAEARQQLKDRVLERASNAFAAAALMPQNEFLAESTRFPDAFEGDDSALLQFADQIKVSPEAILRRLVSLKRVKSTLYKSKRRQWQTRPWFPSRKAKGGAPVEVRIVANAGKPFVSLVLEGYRRSAVSSADVSDYLGVQLKYIDRVRQQLAEGPGSPKKNVLR